MKKESLIHRVIDTLACFMLGIMGAIFIIVCIVMANIARYGW